VRALSANELLEIWEWGLGRTQVERSIGLLVAASEDDAEALLRLSIGQRDSRLLRLRGLIFGAQLECQVACAACGAALELGLRTTDLMVPEVPPPVPVVLEHAGWSIEFRLVDSSDLLHAAQLADPATARLSLLRRCVLSTRTPDGVEMSGLPEVGVPSDIEAALAAAMQQRDPASSLAVGLHCPACEHNSTAPFDVCSFFWSEIEGWAYRTLREVHHLASAYGWREADTLALSAWRRQLYLQMTDYA
jgi:hypothetical protein